MQDTNAIAEAQKILAQIQFHDVLSGTSILVGEQSSIRKADYALELLDKQFTRAFMKLCSDYKRAKAGDYPIAVYNPHPYTKSEIFECEILLLDAIVSDTEGYHFTITKDGVPCPFQIIKEDSNINMDRRKRFAVKADLAPMTVTKFDISVFKGEKQFLDRTPQTEFEIGEGVKVRFDKESGCLASFTAYGKEYLCGNAFAPVVYEDNEDPWGWWLKTVGKNYRYAGVTTSLRVVERGELLTAVESIYDTGKSEVRVVYRMYADRDYVDVTVNITWNDPGCGLKLEIPVATADRFIGQTSFGIQEYESELEQCSHRFCGVEQDGKMLSVFKDGSYGCSLESGKMYLNLINGSI